MTIMKILFVDQLGTDYYPHLIKHLARRGHELRAISWGGNALAIPGLQRLGYVPPRPGPAGMHHAAQHFDLALRRADAVARCAAYMKRDGFTPDLIIGHHGWGELLNIQDVWPDVPILGYFEMFYGAADLDFDPEFPATDSDHVRGRAKNAPYLMALALDSYGQTATKWTHGGFPAWAQDQIDVVPEGVDLELCRPSRSARRGPLDIGGVRIEPHHKLVTYVARELEPHKGFHIFMRALPMVLARKDVRVVILGGDGIRYGIAPPIGMTWRQKYLAELNGKVDLDRVIFPGKVEYQLYLRLLQRSDAHVYLVRPSVASWSLREALACGCAVIGSDTGPVQEFIENGHNGLLTPFLDPAVLAERVLQVLEGGPLVEGLRGRARRYADEHLSLKDTLARYDDLIDRLVGASDATPWEG